MQMRSRRWVGALTSIVAGAAAANAADLAVKAPPPVAPVYLSDWAGFYIGAHAGYGWGGTSFDGGRTWLDAKPQGGLGGVQLGYNWQFGQVVAGVEGDISGADIEQSSVTTGHIVSLATGQTFPLSRDVKFDELSTARARLGYVVFPGVLAYGTAGGAWGHSTATFSGGPFFVPTSTDGFGWSAGAGVEYKLLPHVLLRAEYLHYGFNSFTYDRGSAVVPRTVSGSTDIDVARAGVSYKF
jgi:outer membrane immunogenic protein